MKFTVSMKCPDALHEAVTNAVKRTLPDDGSLNEEYVYLTVDLDEMTCVVKEN